MRLVIRPPRRALAELGCVPKPGWPSGVFAAPVGTRVHLVVLSALPRERSTLVLRLMGRGATQRLAMEDLDALPAYAWERRGVLPFAERFYFDAKKAREGAGEESMVGRYNDMAIEIERRILAKGREEGRVESFVRMFERRLGRALTAEDHTALRQKLDAVGPERMGDMVLDLSGDPLAHWPADPTTR